MTVDVCAHDLAVIKIERIAEVCLGRWITWQELFDVLAEYLRGAGELPDHLDFATGIAFFLPSWIRDNDDLTIAKILVAHYQGASGTSVR